MADAESDNSKYVELTADEIAALVRRMMRGIQRYTEANDVKSYTVAIAALTMALDAELDHDLLENPKAIALLIMDAAISSIYPSLMELARKIETGEYVPSYTLPDEEE